MIEPEGRTVGRRIDWLWPLLTLVALTAGCAQNPVTGANDFVLMSEDQELAIGRQASKEVAKQYHRYDDPALQRYVNDVGRRLAAHSHRPGLVYRFTVLDTPEVNAFALPGGYIYIHRGLLAFLNSEAQLAAILGHEIGHVTARHAVRQYTARQAAGIGLTLGRILVPELGNAGVGNLYQMLGGALLSGYGREQELEADRLGVEYMARSGYEPRAMIEVLDVLKNQEIFEAARARAEGRKPRAYHGLFASHPDNDTRLQQVVAEARGLRVRGLRREDRVAFLKHLDGLTYGPGATQGVIRGNAFYHRELGIGIRFPRDWRLENRRDRLIARAPDGAALLQVLLADLNKRIGPREFMRARMGLADPIEGKRIDAGRLPGYTALAWTQTPYGRRLTRFTVILYDGKAYIFAGARRAPGERRRFRTAFLNIALSLHPLNGEEWRLAAERHLRLRAAKAGVRYAALAARSGLGRDAADRLRLLNQQFPDGEPRPGMLLKIVE